MSAYVEQPASSVDLSVISASIDGGYTSEEALYSIDSKRFEEFKSTVKSVKFKDLIEEHEPEETLSPIIKYKHDPRELFDIFENRESNPSPETPLKEENDDFHINSHSLNKIIQEVANTKTDGDDDDDDASVKSDIVNSEDDMEDHSGNLNDKLRKDVLENYGETIDNFAVEPNEKVSDVNISHSNIENIIAVKHVENISDATSSSANGEGLLQDCPESDVLSCEETTVQSFEIRDLQSNGLHESKKISHEHALSEQKGELGIASAVSDDESRSSSVVQHIRKTWETKIASVTLVNTLQNEVKALKACKLVQDKVITGYAKGTKELQLENDMLKENYDVCLNINKELSLKVQSLSKKLETARIELELATKLNDVEKPLPHDMIETILSSSENNYNCIKSTVQTVMLKNEFLHQALVYVIKRVNNLYRYTLSPVLFLLNEEHDPLKAIPTFDSGNEIQAFIDSNSELFNRISDVNQIVELPSKCDFKTNNASMLKDLDKYFDKINELIASRLESVIQQKT
ncbi:hypothetical protein CANINC_000492 [Pichia inconspicua]|uniref:Uncharacterized protein n=1 Tax=Pichia inconspicua TaxID=52247 RepID=A0A4V6TTT5_9ASCO|nr:hypothetical protein CANINC_000492 [[Candida] inconspicua]